MDPLTIASLATGAFDIAKTIIGRKVTDTNEQQLHMDELVKMHEQNETSELVAQIAVNTAQAGSASFFIAGARPAAMWICNFILGFSAIVKVLLPGLLISLPVLGFKVKDEVTNAVIQLQSIDVREYLYMASSLLGVSYVGRSYETALGVARSAFAPKELNTQTLTNLAANAIVTEVSKRVGGKPQ